MTLRCDAARGWHDVHLRAPLGTARSVGLAGALLLTLAACTQSHSAAVPATPAKFWGYVLEVKGKDTVRVRNRKAKVWTIPSSDLVETDSAGFWSIDIGLIPGEYKVLAEVDGTKGQVAKVPAELGKSTTVHVVLGAEDNAWPPSVAFDRLLPAPTKGPGAVRGSCCE